MVRGTLAAMLATGGYVSVTQTFAQALARSDVARAQRLAPGNGRITARLAASLTGAQASGVDRARADALARDALLHDATAVAAVVALGVNAEVRNDRVKAERLFAYAQFLSRRNLQSQFWAIEHAVRKGNLADAVSHYDIALRTSSVSADVLFPIMASAIDDAEVRAALTKALAARPNWSEAFIGYVAGHGADPRSTAKLFVGLRRAGVSAPRSAVATIVNALVTGGFVDDAWRYYASVHPRADRRASRDANFTAGEAPSLFDWVPVDDGTVTVSIQRDGQSGVFDFAAPASVGGPLLRQMQLLSPGTYRISGLTRGIEQERSAQPYWALSCHDSERELGRVALPNSAEANGRFTGIFIVPEGCAVQMLTLVARPSDAVSGLSGQISHVQLMPAQ